MIGTPSSTKPKASKPPTRATSPRETFAEDYPALGQFRNGNRTSPNASGTGEVLQASILRELEKASLRLIERNFDPGDTIYVPGDPADQLYFLLSGAVRTYKPYGQFKEATTALLMDEGVFGVLDLTEIGSQEDFAEALTRVRVAQIRKASVVWLVKRRPEVALALFSILTERSRRSDELFASLLPREVSSRLAVLLLNLGERFGQEAETGGVVIGLRLTHQGLANMIASTREAVSKAVSEFRREGLLDIARDRKIAILDRAALRKHADLGLSTTRRMADSN